MLRKKAVEMFKITKMKARMNKYIILKEISDLIKSSSLPNELISEIIQFNHMVEKAIHKDLDTSISSSGVFRTVHPAEKYLNFTFSVCLIDIY